MSPYIMFGGAPLLVATALNCGSETWSMRIEERGYKTAGDVRNLYMEKNGENQLDMEHRPHEGPTVRGVATSYTRIYPKGRESEEEVLPFKLSAKLEKNPSRFSFTPLGQALPSFLDLEAFPTFYLGIHLCLTCRPAINRLH